MEKYKINEAVLFDVLFSNVGEVTTKRMKVISQLRSYLRKSNTTGIKHLSENDIKQINKLAKSVQTQNKSASLFEIIDTAPHSMWHTVKS